ncbi:hypothetical protein [Marinobacter fonticola]|uniref:hypothetical protein n=1 Tax=Marinobacter fonticola TaxID=2603215 RepID=UPI0011E60950|nr:hypothetical protein [Marinobacter fonticola]
MLEKAKNRPRLLQLMLIGLFLYGSFSYALSLLEYTWFQTQGSAILGVSESYSSLTTAQRAALDDKCGSHLLPAAGIALTAEQARVVLRCGRFWPFHRYSIEAPNGPVSIDLSDDNTRTIYLINMTWLVLSAAVMSLAGYTVYRVVRRDESAAYRWSLVSFASSLLMVALYVGLMFWADPHFGLGW